MLVHRSVAGTACKQPQQRALAPARSCVTSPRASMSMRQAMTLQSNIASPQRLSLASPALRPGRSHRRPAVQTRAFFDKIFKQDPSEKTRKQYQERVDAINALEPYMQSLSDDQLRAKTQEFKQRVARGETLESLLPEAFAVSTVGTGVHCCCSCTTAARQHTSTLVLSQGFG
jgi:preprotein translocase subunit SecA